MERATALWVQLAERFAGNEWVAGYNLLNEPADPTGDVVGPWHERTVDAIRDVDPDHILLPRRQHLLDRLHRVRRAVRERDLRLPRLRGARGWRSATARAVPEPLEEKFRERTAYQRETGTPIWVGEFGPVYTGVPELDDARLEVLDAQLSLYERYGAGWSLWTYKDVGLQGLVYAGADSAVHAALRRRSSSASRGWASTPGARPTASCPSWSSRSTRSSRPSSRTGSRTRGTCAPRPTTCCATSSSRRRCCRPTRSCSAASATRSSRRWRTRSPRVMRAPRAAVRPGRRAHGGVAQPLKTFSARNFTAFGSCALIRIVLQPRTPTATFWPLESGMITKPLPRVTSAPPPCAAATRLAA